MVLSWPGHRAWRQTLTIAVAFWGGCLALVALEVAFGSNAVIAGMFFLSIPLLVACLTWAARDLVVRRRPQDRFAAVIALGACVMLSSTLIVGVGLLAAANLKTLMVGA